MNTEKKSGPLQGMKVIEMAGIGPAPMTAMLLADLGATVIRIDRRVPADLGIKRPRKYDLLLRNRDIIGVDLKDTAAIALVLDLIGQADALIEGFRPGVMERLGLGPDVALARNPKLAYGRVTGWGQTGPLAMAAGHDLNYVALTGAIRAMGQRDGPPAVPLSLMGDFAGGSLYLAFGLLAAVIEARASGRGQVVDAAMADGVINMQTTFIGMFGAGIFSDKRGTNQVDGGSHFYNVYQCADGEWISVAALEERFHAELLRLLEIDPQQIGKHNDPANWERGKVLFADRFRRRTRAEWSALLEGTDACFAPVLSWVEASKHPHFQARESFCTVDGVLQPATAPRFSRTVPAIPTPPKEITPDNNSSALSHWLTADAVAALKKAGTIA